MGKTVMKPGCMMGPLPAVLVSCADKEGNTNLITAAWTGILNSEPPMAYVSIRPERFSHHMIKETGEFVINLTTAAMAAGTDLCGVKSGRDTDKWKAGGFTPEKAAEVKCPIVKESPVSVECRVKQILPLGSHDMFLGEIVAVDADDAYFDRNGRFDLNRAGLISYVHGSYVDAGKVLGTFGYSVRKKPVKKTGAAAAAGPAEKAAAKKQAAAKKPAAKAAAKKPAAKTAVGKRTAAKGNAKKGS